MYTELYPFWGLLHVDVSAGMHWQFRLAIDRLVTEAAKSC